MSERLYPRQLSTDVINLRGWRVHEEHYPFGPGSKPKGLLWSPTDNDRPYLRADHLYMFKYGVDWRRGQFWSEIVAYELSLLCGVEVPASFVAVGLDGNTVGCLQEIFLGGEGDRRQARLVHGADLLERVTPNYDPVRGRPHLLKTNVRICRTLGVRHALEKWAELLTFDALIGNTDRHPENWGFLWRSVDSARILEFAPAYDNGTSLGYEILDKKIGGRCNEKWIETYALKGTHHIQAQKDDLVGIQHWELCRAFANEYPDMRERMIKVASVDLDAVREILAWCCNFDIAPPFIKERAEFVLMLITYRQKQLLSALENTR